MRPGDWRSFPAAHELPRCGTSTEMDLDAVLARRPEVALVDELAHTNVPGCRNAKRWQDVDELLDARGIDVDYHAEHPAPGVAQRRGEDRSPACRSARPCPDDDSRARAEQVELVDMTPEALRRRMVHGNVYAAGPDRRRALHYFRVGNLTALRELALLWVADRVEEGLLEYRAEHGIGQTWEARERVVVALTGARKARRSSAAPPGSLPARSAATCWPCTSSGPTGSPAPAPRRSPAQRAPVPNRWAAPTTR